MKSDTIESTESSITEEAVASSATNIIPRGNVVIATRVGLGKVCILARDTAINQDLRGVIPRSDEIVGRFLYHWFRWVAPRIVEEGTGATVQGVKLPFIKSLPFPILPRNEQERIVAILDEAFEGIADAKAKTQSILTKARELFESCLEDAVEGGRVGRRRYRFGEICSLENGAQPPKATFSKIAAEGYVRLIQIRDYKSDNHVVYIKEEFARSKCEADDVMIGRYGPPLFQILRGLKGAYNVALLKTVPDETRICKDYLFRFLNGRRLRDVVVANSERAAGQTGIRKELLENYPISLPDIPTQRIICGRMNDLEKACQSLSQAAERKLAALEELKQSLLHQAFSGDL